MAITNWSECDRLFVTGMDTILKSASTTFFMEQNALNWGADFNGVDGIVVRNYVPTGLQSITGSTSTIVDANTQASTYKLEQKRSLVKAIDKFTNMNTNYALSVAKIISNETKGGIVPEVDAYRWNTLFKQAPEANVTYEDDFETKDVYQAVKKTISKLRAKVGVSVPLVVGIRTTLWDEIADSTKVAPKQITENGIQTEVFRLNSAYFIPVSDELMGTKFTANELGFTVEGTLNYVVLPMQSAFACIKATKDANGQSFGYIDQIAGSTRAVVQAFFNHDAFVMKEHENLIFASVKETKLLAPKTLAEPTATSFNATFDGMDILGQE